VSSAPVQGGPPPVADDLSFSMGAPTTTTSFMLSGARQVIIPIQAGNKFSGTVGLTTDLSDIDANVQFASGRVAATVSPASVTLSPGQTASVTVNIATTTSRAPSFSDRKILLKASGAGASQQIDIPVTLQPVFEVYEYGPLNTNAHTWTTDPGNLVAAAVIPPGMSVPFCPHPDGLTLRFINRDSAGGNTMVIHSAGGLINHQNTGAPTPLNGVMTYTIKSTTTATSPIWEHNREPSSRQRFFQLNQSCS
jgi:hypothetical protein